MCLGSITGRVDDLQATVPLPDFLLSVERRRHSFVAPAHDRSWPSLCLALLILLDKSILSLLFSFDLGRLHAPDTPTRQRRKLDCTQKSASLSHIHHIPLTLT